MPFGSSVFNIFRILDKTFSFNKPSLKLFLVLQAPANYEFKYGVRDEHTHDIKEQAEKRVGDKVTGYYSLLEPDGNTRTVHYSSDKHTGFLAQVTRSGHSTHPAAPVKVVAAPVVSYEPAISHPATSYGSLGSSLAVVSGGYHNL